MKRGRETMRKLLCLFLLMTEIASAQVKISQIPTGSAAGITANDSFPYVDSIAATTKRLLGSDLANIPALVAAFAPGRNTATTRLDYTIPTLTRDYILNIIPNGTTAHITFPNAGSSASLCIRVKVVGSSSYAEVLQFLAAQTLDGNQTVSLYLPNQSSTACAVGGNWFAY